LYLLTSTNVWNITRIVVDIKAYADKNNCDVIVLDRDYYVDGSGKYETILVQEDDELGRNLFAQKTFDFVHKGQNMSVPPFRHLPKIQLN
jgi:retron-type reverse transcriptase